MAGTASKPTITVPATASSTAAYAAALSAYTRVLWRHASALDERGDAATVHGFRVALRALRSLFKAAKDFFDEAPRAHFQAEFTWLSQRSAPVRDLDVLCAALPGYLAGVAESAQRLESGLVPVLAATRASYYADLRTALHSARYRRLVKDWQAALATLRTASVKVPTIGTHVHRALARRGRAILRFRRRQLAQPEFLHAFRKHCKRLRYLLEAFQTLFEPEQLQATLKACREVQTVCGERWDLEVHAALLASLAPRVRPPLAAADLSALMNALTIARESGSTLAMNASKDFQRNLSLPDLCIPPEDARS